MLRFQTVLLTLLFVAPIHAFAQNDDADLEAQFMDEDFSETPTTPTTLPPSTATPIAPSAPSIEVPLVEEAPIGHEAPVIAEPLPAAPPDDLDLPPEESFPPPEIQEPAFTDTPEPEGAFPQPEIQAEPIPEPEMQAPVAQAPQEAAPIGDEPDLAKEARFHRIYKMFNQQPTSNEQWNTALGKSTQSTYQIQKGDNLWSLSQTLFADPNFWPKIWSLNSGTIENPHEIRPGKSLQFTPGTMGDAPTLAVTDSPAAPGTAEVAQTSAEPTGPEALPVGPNGEPDFSKVKIQEPKRAVIPVVPPPRSLPKWKYRGEGDKEPLILELTQVNRNFGSPQMVLPYFATEGELPAFGEVVGTEGGFVSATDYQYITIKMSQALSEKLATAVRVTDHISAGKLNAEAKVVQVQGEIEIMETVNSREGLYRAMVTRSVAPIEIGAKLIAGPMPTYSVKEDGDVVNLDGQIIGGYSFRGKVFGDDSIVYFNKGSRQGVTVGQIINIYKSVPVRVANSKVIENELPLGRIKVLRTSENFLTAVVLKANEDIRVGDSGIRNQSKQ